MKDTIRDQIKALADKNGWLLIIIGLAAVGFSDIKMTMIYAHLAPDYLGDEMDRLKFVGA